MTDVQRPLTVAVTGHRWNGLADADPALLAKRVDVMLEALRSLAARGDKSGSRRFDPSRVLVVSAIAEGADRIVAERALALGMELRALLPLPRDDYADDFPTDASKEEFRGLLARAHEVRELVSHHGERSAAYETLGLRLLGAADVLLAVWDGGESRGEGGTASVVAHAFERGLPILWVHAARPHELSVSRDGGMKRLPPDQRTLADELNTLLA